MILCNPIACTWIQIGASVFMFFAICMNMMEIIKWNKLSKKTFESMKRYHEGAAKYEVALALLQAKYPEDFEENAGK